MNILLIGAGGREHTFAWKIKQSSLCKNLYIAPGNAGTETLGINLPVAIADFEAIAKAALVYTIDIILVGPEEPLVKGIVDFFMNNQSTKHIGIIGPAQQAAQLEGSKAYAKSFMHRYNIPTAEYKEFTFLNFEEGCLYIKNHSLPIVLKADGLAAGKGVLICETHIEALAEFELMLIHSKFGDAGNKVVIEEYLTGIEMSIFLLTDGKNYLFLPEAKDYKRIGEGDTGLNTGGMGAVSPVPILTPQLKEKIIRHIATPTVQGLQQDNLHYKGFIFVGLMIENGEPKVIEYNCRMGDPETEVVLPRLKNDFVALLAATINGTLNELAIDIETQAAVAVVAVSGGYPGEYVKGKIIYGLEENIVKGSMVFHAGTIKENENIITTGGRVLIAVSLGDNIKEAAEQSEYILQNIHFTDMKYRSDIGYEFK